MNIERMQRWSSFLRNEVPPDQFDIRDWFSSLRRKYVVAGPVSECGTIACALGWACAIPEFRAAGLLPSGNPFDPTPIFYSFRGNEAGARFFDLPMDVADDIFYYEPWSYPKAQSGAGVTTTMVADKIDGLIEAELERLASEPQSPVEVAKIIIASVANTKGIIAKALQGAKHEESTEHFS